MSLAELYDVARVLEGVVAQPRKLQTLRILLPRLFGVPLDDERLRISQRKVQLWLERTQFWAKNGIGNDAME